MWFECVTVVYGWDLHSVLTLLDTKQVRRCMTVQYEQTNDKNVKVTKIMSPRHLLDDKTGIVCDMPKMSDNEMIDFLYCDMGWFLFLFLLVNNKIYSWKEYMRPYCSNFPVKMNVLCVMNCNIQHAILKKPQKLN